MDTKIKNHLKMLRVGVIFSLKFVDFLATDPKEHSEGGFKINKRNIKPVGMGFSVTSPRIYTQDFFFF